MGEHLFSLQSKILERVSGSGAFNEVEAHFLSLVARALSESSLNDFFVFDCGELSEQSEIAFFIVLDYLIRRHLRHSIDSLKSETNADISKLKGEKLIETKLRLKSKHSPIKQIVFSHLSKIFQPNPIYSSESSEIRTKELFLSSEYETNDTNDSNLSTFTPIGVSEKEWENKQKKALLMENSSSSSLDLSDLVPQGLSDKNWEKKVNKEVTQIQSFKNITINLKNNSSKNYIKPRKTNKRKQSNDFLESSSFHSIPLNDSNATLSENALKTTKSKPRHTTNQNPNIQNDATSSNLDTSDMLPSDIDIEKWMNDRRKKIKRSYQKKKNKKTSESSSSEPSNLSESLSSETLNAVKDISKLFGKNNELLHSDGNIISNNTNKAQSNSSSLINLSDYSSEPSNLNVESNNLNQTSMKDSKNSLEINSLRSLKQAIEFDSSKEIPKSLRTNKFLLESAKAPSIPTISSSKQNTEDFDSLSDSSLGKSNSKPTIPQLIEFKSYESKQDNQDYIDPKHNVNGESLNHSSKNSSKEPYNIANETSQTNKVENINSLRDPINLSNDTNNSENNHETSIINSEEASNRIPNLPTQITSNKFDKSTLNNNQDSDVNISEKNEEDFDDLEEYEIIVEEEDLGEYEEEMNEYDENEEESNLQSVNVTDSSFSNSDPFEFTPKSIAKSGFQYADDKADGIINLHPSPSENMKEVIIASSSTEKSDNKIKGTENLDDDINIALDIRHNNVSLKMNQNIKEKKDEGQEINGIDQKFDLVIENSNDGFHFPQVENIKKDDQPVSTNSPPNFQNVTNNFQKLDTPTQTESHKSIKIKRSINSSSKTSKKPKRKVKKLQKIKSSSSFFDDVDVTNEGSVQIPDILKKEERLQSCSSQYNEINSSKETEIAQMNFDQLIEKIKQNDNKTNISSKDVPNNSSQTTRKNSEQQTQKSKLMENILQDNITIKEVIEKSSESDDSDDLTAPFNFQSQNKSLKTQPINSDSSASSSSDFFNDLKKIHISSLYNNKFTKPLISPPKFSQQHSDDSMKSSSIKQNHFSTSMKKSNSNINSSSSINYENKIKSEKMTSHIPTCSDKDKSLNNLNQSKDISLPSKDNAQKLSPADIESDSYYYYYSSSEINDRTSPAYHSKSNNNENVKVISETAPISESFHPNKFNFNKNELLLKGKDDKNKNANDQAKPKKNALDKMDLSITKRIQKAQLMDNKSNNMPKIQTKEVNKQDTALIKDSLIDSETSNLRHTSTNNLPFPPIPESKNESQALNVTIETDKNDKKSNSSFHEVPPSNPTIRNTSELYTANHINDSISIGEACKKEVQASLDNINHKYLEKKTKGNSIKNSKLSTVSQHYSTDESDSEIHSEEIAELPPNLIITPRKDAIQKKTLISNESSILTTSSNRSNISSKMSSNSPKKLISFEDLIDHIEKERESSLKDNDKNSNSSKSLNIRNEQSKKSSDDKVFSPSYYSHSKLYKDQRKLLEPEFSSNSNKIQTLRKQTSHEIQISNRNEAIMTNFDQSIHEEENKIENSKQSLSSDLFSEEFDKIKDQNISVIQKDNNDSCSHSSTISAFSDGDSDLDGSFTFEFTPKNNTDKKLPNNKRSSESDSSFFSNEDSPNPDSDKFKLIRKMQQKEKI